MSKTLLTQYILYAKDMGLIRDLLGHTELMFNGADIPFTIPGGLKSVGLQSNQLVDIHYMYAFSPLNPAPDIDTLTNRVIQPVLPPACLVVVNRHLGRVIKRDEKRIITMSNQKELVLDDNEALRWAIEGVALSAYEIYIVSGRDVIPSNVGKDILTMIAVVMKTPLTP